MALIERTLRRALRPGKLALAGLSAEHKSSLEAVIAPCFLKGDVLLAVPQVGPALRALGRLAEEHDAQTFSVLCEDADRVGEIPAKVGIFVDLNPGMDRTGIPLDSPRSALLCVHAADPRELELLFFHLLDRGLFIAPRGFIALSMAITDEHTAALVHAVEDWAAP